MPIRLLPPTLVNRIAAGEVVERPASAVKELVENSLDACANHIRVNIVDGGRALITVTDDGNGMEAEELLMAVERHATSKVPDDDLTRVTSLGFRGEALPAIGAVARLTITSRCRWADSAWSLAVTASRRGGIVPAAHPHGTRVDVRDLFFATPARLKFLKGSRVEAFHVRDILERLALAHPMVSFTLSNDGQSVLHVQAAADLDQKKLRAVRIARLMGRAFVDNAVSVSAEHDGIALGGLISLPPFEKKSTASQYFFLNGRPIRDRLLGKAVRTAYQNILSNHNILPLSCLFLTMAPDRVDINVHPAKAEVRFRDSETVRTILVAAIHHALAEHRIRKTVCSATHCNERGLSLSAQQLSRYGRVSRVRGGHAIATEPFSEQHLGLARTQIHSTYIIAETPDGVIIVDQHAAQERLIRERLRNSYKDQSARLQRLLKEPEVVHLKKRTLIERVVNSADELRAFGFVIEPFGQESVIVRAIPALLGEIDVHGLIQALGEGLVEVDPALDLQEQQHHICMIMASFYGRSVRPDGGLTLVEMNALLRQIEVTLHTAQFTDSRPTYVEWKLKDLKKLFRRC